MHEIYTCMCKYVCVNEQIIEIEVCVGSNSFRVISDVLADLEPFHYEHEPFTMAGRSRSKLKAAPNLFNKVTLTKHNRTKPNIRVHVHAYTVYTSIYIYIWQFLFCYFAQIGLRLSAHT